MVVNVWFKALHILSLALMKMLQQITPKTEISIHVCPTASDSWVMPTSPVEAPSTSKVTLGPPVVFHAGNAPWNLPPPSYFTANWQGRISVDWCGNTPLIEHHRCSCWKPWFVTHDNGAGSFLKVGCCFWKMWIRRRNKNYHNKGAWHLVFRYVPQVLLEPCPYLDPNQYTLATHSNGSTPSWTMC